MANTIKIKRGSGSDPAASDMVLGEPVLRTDTAELFFKKDDGSVAKVSGGGGGPDFKYLALRNAANNGAASFPNADFTLVTSGTTNAITPAAANTLLVSVNGVIQKPNTGTSTPSQGFALSGSTIKFGANISSAPDFILYQESGGIGEPSDETVSEEKLKVSNSPVNGYFLSAQSGNTGGLTWAAPVATSCTGNSATATALATARTINGTSFDGTANITVTAAAGTLTGNTLNSSVTASSLTSLGDLAGLTVNGDMSLTGANYNVLWDKSDNALEFADNAKATFGGSAALQIYHSGSGSFIKDAGTGNLNIASDAFRVLNAGATENMITADENGSVSLYYDNSKKFQTLSTGAAVTGALSVSNGLAVSGDVLSIAAGTDIRFTNSSSTWTGSVPKIQHYNDTLYIVGGTGGIRFREMGQDRWDINGDGHFVPRTDSTYNIGSNSIRVANGYFDTLYGDGSNLTGISSVGGATGVDFNDNVKARFGNSSDLQIYHDGTNNYIEGNNQKTIIRNTSNNIHLQAVSGEAGIDILPNSAVKLYHNGNQKLETSSVGVNVTGNFNVADGILTINHTTPIINFTDNSASNGNDYAIQVNTNLFKIVDTTNSNRLGFQFGSDGNTQLGGNVTINGSIFLGTHLDMGDSDIIKLGDSDDLQIYHNGTNSQIDNNSGDLNIRSNVIRFRAANNEQYITAIANGAVELYYDNSRKFMTESTGVKSFGIIVPSADNTHDLGTSSLRWRNIFTADLQLSNKGSSNDVDGTWGSYTIQEGEESLFLINRRNGKKYKFNLTEVS